MSQFISLLSFAGTVILFEESKSASVSPKEKYLSRVYIQAPHFKKEVWLGTKLVRAAFRDPKTKRIRHYDYDSKTFTEIDFGKPNSAKPKIEPAAEIATFVNVRKDQRTRWPCQVVDTKIGGKLVNEVCVSEPGALGISKADLGLLQYFGYTAPLDAKSKDRGLVIWQKKFDPDRIKVLTELKLYEINLKQPDLPMTAFAFPEGFKKIETTSTIKR